MLSAWDDKSSADSIIFTLTSQPKYGRLESVSSPGRPLTSFSQVDLAAGRIRYIHTIGDSSLSDGFEFEVSESISKNLSKQSILFVRVVEQKIQMVVLVILELRHG